MVVERDLLRWQSVKVKHTLPMPDDRLGGEDTMTSINIINSQVVRGERLETIAFTIDCLRLRETKGK